MAIIPQQLRSVDPWSENRFSDNYNIRSRMLTGGADSIVFLESFTITQTDDTIITVGPGVAIKDDVLIHITETVTMNLAVNQGYSYNNEGEPPITDPDGDYVLHLCLNYHYARSIPAPQAKYVLIKYPNTHFSTINHLWLGRITVVGGIITDCSTLAIRIPDTDLGTVYERHTIDPINGYAQINGGVVRPAVPNGTPDGWYEEWQYI